MGCIFTGIVVMWLASHQNDMWTVSSQVLCCNVLLMWLTSHQIDICGMLFHINSVWHHSVLSNMKIERKTW